MNNEPNTDQKLNENHLEKINENLTSPQLKEQGNIIKNEENIIRRSIFQMKISFVFDIIYKKLYFIRRNNNNRAKKPRGHYKEEFRQLRCILQ